MGLDINYTGKEKEIMRKIKKNTHKLMSMFLAVLMVFGCFSAWPTQVSAAESDYEIYPKPHLMEYQSGDYVIHQNINIVYEDEDIIVINKPAGMPIHPSMNNYTNSMANALAWYYQQQNKPFIFRCSNRLDRDTSGLTVVAKHLVSGNILSCMVRDHKIDREYLALVRGHVTPPTGTIHAPLARKGGTIIERIVDFEHGETAVTHYHTLSEKNGHSLVSLHLETGRTHQIRVHMKHLGFPLIGDYLYNPDMEYMTRQALHSHKLIFKHPITGEPMRFTAPLPDDMLRVLTMR